MFATVRMNKILIDTNVLIYAKDASSIYHRASLSVFDNESDFRQIPELEIIVPKQYT